MKPFTSDELGLDNPERIKFVKEQKAMTPYCDHYFATVRLTTIYCVLISF